MQFEDPPHGGGADAVAEPVGDALELYPVSEKVNKPAFDAPACIEAVEPAPVQPGLFG